MSIIGEATAPLVATDRMAFGVDQAAEAISIGSSTMWRWIHQGKIKTVKLGGRTLIRREELIRLLDGAETNG